MSWSPSNLSVHDGSHRRYSLLNWSRKIHPYALTTMKEIISKQLSNTESYVYKWLNALIVGIILYSFITILQLTVRHTDEYFEYQSITPTSYVFSATWELYFTSILERYQATNMRYNDTLFCGFSEDKLFWYSQSKSEFNNAPAWKFISQWRYDGDTPTIPMVCQLRSAPYAYIGYGINTLPQKVDTPLFYVR